MNSDNLIMLGIYAAARWNIRSGVKIMRIPSDSPNNYRIAIQDRLYNNVNEAWSRYGVTDYDDITLEKFGSKDNFEYIRVGYSRRANVLVIKEND